jgi:hypothetical protein
MAYNASPSYEHIFYIGGTGISGIRDLNFSYGVSRTPVNALGVGHVQPVLAEALQGEISMTRDLIYSDPILSLTGDVSIDGSIIYASDLSESSGQVIGFTSGYLTSYSVSASIGDVPTIQTNFSVFGKMGSGVRLGELDYSGVTPTQIVGFLNQRDIEVSIEQSTTNRITQFEQSFNVERVPIYDLKEKTSENYYAPTQIITKTPIEVTSSFTVEIDDFETANLMDNTRSGVYKRINGVIKFPEDNINGLRDHSGPIGDFIRDDSNNVIEDAGYKTMFEFASISGNLISESVTTSIDGLLNVNLEFRNYLK